MFVMSPLNTQNTQIFNHKTHKTYKKPRRRADDILRIQ